VFLTSALVGGEWSASYKQNVDGKSIREKSYSRKQDVGEVLLKPRLRTDVVGM
jgi:hypothetical protein